MQVINDRELNFAGSSEKFNWSYDGVEGCGYSKCSKAYFHITVDMA